MPVASLALTIATVKRDASAKVADADIETLFRARFGECVLSAGQLFPLEKDGTTLQLKVLKMEPPVVDGKSSSPILHGTLDASTEVGLFALNSGLTVRSST